LALGEAQGWLEKLGFIDFAGSTVVHSIGGWVALAAILVLGPRLGRFSQKRPSIEGYSLPFALLGTFLLWFGWFGFNGGSTLALDDSVPGILINTLLGAAAGGLVAISVTWFIRGHSNIVQGMNGVLAGLVAITANCHLVGGQEALIIGGIGAAVCLAASALLVKFQIDDVVDAVPVHLAAGIWGTLAVALFGDPSGFVGGSRLDQLWIQLIGIGAAGTLAFGVSFPLFFAVNKVLSLRVSRRDEYYGLNLSEHGARSAYHDILIAMRKQAETGDFSKPVPSYPFSEAGLVGRQYNKVLERVEQEVESREKIADELLVQKREAEIANAAKSQFIANVSHELRTPLNAIIGFSQMMNNELLGPIENEQYKEYMGDIEKSGTHLLGIINDIIDLSRIEASKRDLAEDELEISSLISYAIARAETRAREIS